MSKFGELKLQVIPEGVRHSVYSKHLKMHQEGSKFPSYASFFNECLNTCHEMNISLRSNWSLFFDECKERRIDPKKEPCTIPHKEEEFKPREIAPYTEEDFWKVERDVVSQPIKWQKLGYIKNPWAAFMLTIDKYEHADLYLLYLQSHPEGEMPLPDKLLVYHEALRKKFNIQ